MSVEHICKQHPTLPKERVTELVEQARSETRDLSLKTIVNLRTEQAFRRRKTGDSVNHGEIAIQAQKDYEADPARMARGKLVLGRLKALLQKELGYDSALIAPSPHIKDARLCALAASVWPQVDLESRLELVPVIETD